MASIENRGIQNRGWFNKNIQEIINKYGLDEKTVLSKLDELYRGLKDAVEESGTMIVDDIEKYIQSIVCDSTAEILLKIDEIQNKTESAIQKAVKKNLEDVGDELLKQLHSSFSIRLSEAKKENEKIIDILMKWKNESEYQARCAQEACTAFKFISGFFKSAKSTAMHNLEYGRYLLRNGYFSDAKKCFEDAKSDSALDSEATFYSVLARCYIQPAWDYNVGREVPLIYDINTANIKDDNFFKKAVKYETDDNKRNYYIQFADQIEHILKEYELIDGENKKGRYDYECFVCVKQSEPNDKYKETKDFENLKSSGILERLEDVNIKTFVAYRDLDESLPIEKGSNDYNAFILYALQKAKVLLLVCSESEYAQTAWVKNEYMRFMNFHKNPQIVVIGTNKAIKIPNISNKTQFVNIKEIDKIVSCVKEKVEIEEKYIDSECFYCEKCGRSYSFQYDACSHVIDGRQCSGKLISAVEHSNKIIKENQIALRDIMAELVQEKKRREQAKAEAEQAKSEATQVRAEAERRTKQAEQAKIEAENRAQRAEAYSKIQDISNMLHCAFFKINESGEVRAETRYYSDIILPPNTKKINDSAFSDYDERAIYYFNNITIPSGVISIGESAFARCDELYSVVFAENSQLTSIGDKAFCGCSCLTNISIPSGVKSIGNEAFRGCSSLTNIVIPSGVTSISDGVFAECEELASITIPSGVKSIGNEAFRGCSSLTNIVIPSGVTSISDGVFAECEELASITIPSGVKSIGYEAFSGCSSLTSIEIPNSVTEIDTYAFFGCDALTSIVIPKSVISMGSNIFNYCDNLQKIYCEAKSKPDDWDDEWHDDCEAEVIWGFVGEHFASMTECGILAENDSKENAIAGHKNLYWGEDYPTLQYYNKSNFYFDDTTLVYCDSNISKEQIPDGVMHIGECAFTGCNNLTSVTIPNSVISIGRGAFYGCSNLLNINYIGTKEQWIALKKGNEWDYNTGNYIVHCTDGDIAKS